MPRPPPPAAALTSTGYPIFWAIARASSSSVMTPFEPGTQGMPASSASARAAALSPTRSMVSAEGPMNSTWDARQTSAKCAFSERNP